MDPAGTVFVGNAQAAPSRFRSSATRFMPRGAPTTDDGAFPYRLWARRAADAACDDLLAHHPHLFAAPAGWERLEPAYRAWLTYRFLQHETAPLAALAADPQLRSVPRLALQTAVPARIVTRLLLEAGRPASLPFAETVSGAEAPSADLVLSTAGRWMAGEPRPRRTEREGVAFIVGTPAEATWMHEVAKRLDPLSSTMVLKRKRPELVAAAKDVSHPRRPIASWRGLSRGVLEARDHARLTAALLDVVAALREEENEALRDHGGWLLAFFDHAVSATGLAAITAPRAIAGSLEKSPIGLVLSALAPGLGMRTFTVQHGNIAPQGMLDLVRFDAFGLWNDGVCETLTADGYPAAAPRYVIGRPPTAPATAEERQAIARIREWTGSRRSVVLFLQPNKPPHVTASATADLLDAALAIVGGGERHALLVKLHPSQGEAERDVLRDGAAFHPALRILDAEEDRMAVATAVCDVALSLNSTALADAAAAGRPAVAFERRGSIEASDLGLPASIPLARNEEELRTLLDEAAASPRPASPSFPDAVAAVVRQLLPAAVPKLDPRVVAHVTLQPTENDARVRRTRTALEAAGYACPIVGPGHGFDLPAMGLARKARIALSFGIAGQMSERAARAAFFSFPAHRNAVDALVAFRPAAIHAHDWDGAVVGAEAARRLGVPFVYDAHEFAADMHAERRGWRWTVAPTIRRLEGPAARQAARVLTVSEILADALQDELSLAERPVVVRNLPEIRTSRVPHAPSRAADGLLLHYHGILARGRGLETAIEALALLPDRVRLRLTGPWRQSGFESTVDERVRALSLRHRVEIVPMLAPEALVEHAAEADLGLCLLSGRSRHDDGALPNKVFEYLHAGLPVIASGSREVAALLGEEGCGVTVAPDDPRALADAVLSLAPGDLARMAERARLTAGTLTWSKDAATLVALWRTILPQPL